MTIAIKQEADLIKVRQYIIDNERHKVVVIIDIDEVKWRERVGIEPTYPARSGTDRI